MDTLEKVPPETTPTLVLAALGLLAGAGGMAVSFLSLASNGHLDVIAGAAGFIGGAVLTAAGLISLAVQSSIPITSTAATRVARCLVAALPPMVAVLAWPVLYFRLFLAGILLVPFVLIGCWIWAWMTSDGVAVDVAARFGWRRVRLVRAAVFGMQSLAILASWPLFILQLNLLESMGYKVGWS